MYGLSVNPEISCDRILKIIINEKTWGMKFFGVIRFCSDRRSSRLELPANKNESSTL